MSASQANPRLRFSDRRMAPNLNLTLACFLISQSTLSFLTNLRLWGSYMALWEAWLALQNKIMENYGGTLKIEIEIPLD